jgi:Ni,Fe-hydrogenase I large subunit
LETQKYILTWLSSFDNGIVSMITRFRNYLDPIISFVDDVYLADVNLLAQIYTDYYEIGRGYGNLFAFGVFDLNRDGSSKLLPRGRVANGSSSVQGIDLKAIVEQTEHSWYNNSSAGLNPAQGETAPAPEKAGAYSWLKAPRYNGILSSRCPPARLEMAMRLAPIPLPWWLFPSESFAVARCLAHPLHRMTGR